MKQTTFFAFFFGFLVASCVVTTEPSTAAPQQGTESLARVTKAHGSSQLIRGTGREASLDPRPEPWRTGGDEASLDPRPEPWRRSVGEASLDPRPEPWRTGGDEASLDPRPEPWEHVATSTDELGTSESASTTK